MIATACCAATAGTGHGLQPKDDQRNLPAVRPQNGRESRHHGVSPFHDGVQHVDVQRQSDARMEWLYTMAKALMGIAGAAFLSTHSHTLFTSRVGTRSNMLGYRRKTFKTQHTHTLREQAPVQQW